MEHYYETIGVFPKHGLTRAYITGFLLSLVLTVVAYGAAVEHVFSRGLLISVLILLALLQFVIQAGCFLHVGFARAGRLRLMLFLAIGVIVLILVAGSVWIMNNLNGRMMPNTAQMEAYMNGQLSF